MRVSPTFVPTANNMYVISYPEEMKAGSEFDFPFLFKQSQELERDGKIEEACNLRFIAFQHFMEMLPDDEEVILDWDEEENQLLLDLINSTALDHFLLGDFDLSAGMFELLLDLDPEDHLGGTTILAYCYVALEEYDLFDEVINDISDKYPEKEILKIWSEYRQTGSLHSGEIIHLKKNFPAVYQEFIAEEHPINTQYLTELAGEKLSRESAARQLWLQTEHLWQQFPGFIESLKTALK